MTRRAGKLNRGRTHRVSRELQKGRHCVPTLRFVMLFPIYTSSGRTFIAPSPGRWAIFTILV